MQNQLQQVLQDKDHRILELEDMYNEKVRKCHAWEKVMRYFKMCHEAAFYVEIGKFYLP